MSHPCEICGTPVRDARYFTCSLACRTARTLPRAQARFWKHVLKTDGCWLWTSHKTRDGYGRPTIKFVSYHAHRLVWEWTYGPIPPGMCVCHRCDTPQCVRPDHLFLGSTKDNNRDAVIKGRHSKGSERYNARLTEEQVAEIKVALRQKAQHLTLSRKYGVCKAVISHIQTGRNWKHVSI